MLLHGMMGSRRAGWQVVPLLVASNYRVSAVDLPGHGLSPRDDTMTVDRAARSIAESVASECGSTPDVVMGHSYGGLLLAAAVDTRECSCRRARSTSTLPSRRVAAGTAPNSSPSTNRTSERARTYRAPSLEAVLQRPGLRIEARAADHFDPATAASPAAGPGVAFEPHPGSIIVRAKPSLYVDDVTAAHHESRGVIVRDVPGAAHSVWYSHFHQFVATLPEVFQ